MQPLFASSQGASMNVNSFLSVRDLANLQRVNSVINQNIDSYYHTETGKDRYQEKEYCLKKMQVFLKEMGGDLTSFNRWKDYKREIRKIPSFEVDMEYPILTAIFSAAECLYYRLFLSRPVSKRMPEPIFRQYDREESRIRTFFPNGKI